MQQLYHAIFNDEIENDKEACQLLFGKDKDRRYAKVKHRLKQQMLDTVLLLEPKEKGLSDYHETFTVLRKKLCVADVMRREGKYAVVYDVAKKVREKADEAEMAGLCLHSANLLMTYYLFGDPKAEERKEYIAMARKYSYLYQAEIEAYACFQELMEKLEDVKVKDEEKLRFAEGLLTKLDKAYPDVSTIEYNVFYNTIQISAKLYNSDYDAIKAICRQQIDILEDKPVYPRGHVRNYLFQLINVSLPTKDFETGKAAYEHLLKIVDPGVRPWFRAKQFYIYLAIHTEDYALAFETCNNVINHRKFRNQKGLIRERFLLLRAYTTWLNRIGMIDDDEHRSRSFRLGKFMNEVPEFSKEKRGFNISILVIQLLWVITRNQYDLAEDRLTALDRYLHRNLKKTPDLERTYYFLKAIAKLRSAGFNRAKFEEKTKGLLKTLEDIPSTANPDAIEIEILPYEKIYELLLEQL
ncbi:MAG: hypothetical protein AAGF87_00980 [Bacteroidota bacterium]